MVDNSLSITVEADTDDAVESIREVTEAVEELEAALASLQGSCVEIQINTPGSEEAIREVSEAEVKESARDVRRNSGHRGE